ncbi:MAG: hypothetical protein KC462_06850, partial [Cyanobacteria bacterium HKST-UBA05]|nr:hypothetical protein [Cyanobacteria bacterium HKST-UBA05]
GAAHVENCSVKYSYGCVGANIIATSAFQAAAWGGGRGGINHGRGHERDDGGIGCPAGKV